MIFKAEVVWIDLIYKMFKPPLVLALLRDELREHGVYYQSQFWRLVPPHFVYFSLILSKNSVKAGKDLSHFMRLFGEHVKIDGAFFSVRRQTMAKFCIFG